MTVHKTFETIMIESLNPKNKAELDIKIKNTEKAVRLAKHPRQKAWLERSLKGLQRMRTGG